LEIYLIRSLYYKHKNKCKVTHKFCCGSCKNLARSYNWQGKGGRAGGSNELDAARSNQIKLLFHILLLSFLEEGRISHLLRQLASQNIPLPLKIPSMG
jgi:hypothetical protein